MEAAKESRRKTKKKTKKSTQSREEVKQSTGSCEDKKEAKGSNDKENKSAECKEEVQNSGSILAQEKSKSEDTITSTPNANSKERADPATLSVSQIVSEKYFPCERIQASSEEDTVQITGVESKLSAIGSFPNADEEDIQSLISSPRLDIREDYLESISSCVSATGIRVWKDEIETKGSREEQHVKGSSSVISSQSTQSELVITHNDEHENIEIVRKVSTENVNDLSANNCTISTSKLIRPSSPAEIIEDDQTRATRHGVDIFAGAKEQSKEPLGLLKAYSNAASYPIRIRSLFALPSLLPPTKQDPRPSAPSIFNTTTQHEFQNDNLDHKKFFCKAKQSTSNGLERAVTEKPQSFIPEIKPFITQFKSSTAAKSAPVNSVSEKVPLRISWKEMEEQFNITLDDSDDEAWTTIEYYKMILREDLLPPRRKTKTTGSIECSSIRTASEDSSDASVKVSDSMKNLYSGTSLLHRNEHSQYGCTCCHHHSTHVCPHHPQISCEYSIETRPGQDFYPCTNSYGICHRYQKYKKKGHHLQLQPYQPSRSHPSPQQNLHPVEAKRPESWISRTKGIFARARNAIRTSLSRSLKKDQSKHNEGCAQRSNECELVDPSKTAADLLTPVIDPQVVQIVNAVPKKNNGENLLFT